MAKRPLIALACLPPDFAETLETHLDRRGYEVRRASEDFEVQALLASPGADVLVLGDTLAPTDAVDLMRRFQAHGNPSVILLRTRPDLIETVLALELGAADVVHAPFSERELAARIAGLLARRGKTPGHLIVLENCTVDLKSALLMHRSGNEEQLAPGQIALLRLFLNNPRKVLTRDALIAGAPAENADAFDRSIDSRIVRLRRKLDTETIVTVRGAGYRFDPPSGWPD